MNDLLALPNFHHYLIISLFLTLFTVFIYLILKYYPKFYPKKTALKKKDPCKILKNLNFKKRDELYIFSLEVQQITDKDDKEFISLNQKLTAFKYSQKEIKIPDFLKNELKKYIRNLCSSTTHNT